MPAKRGLAAVDEETRRAITRKGGLAAQASGHAHQLTEEERRKGGKNSPTNFALRPQEVVKEIGRRGGSAFHKNRQKKDKTEDNGIMTNDVLPVGGAQ